MTLNEFYWSVSLFDRFRYDKRTRIVAPEFVNDHMPPGKSDDNFDLKIAGRDAATPGPNAIKEMPE